MSMVAGIGQGRSNRQIAARLVASQRTVESHVENVLRKLGFASRVQVAAWITTQHRDGSPAGRADQQRQGCTHELRERRRQRAVHPPADGNLRV
jgi:hypothetical protein